MKIRKLKLISSLASLVLVFAVLGVGVWAAASQTVTVRTTVSFVATGVSGTITGTLTGVGDTQYYNSTMAAGGTAITFSPSSDALSNWTLGDTTALTIDSTDGVASDIVYTFTITNTSTNVVMNASVTDVTAGTNLEIVSVKQGDTALTASTDTYTLTEIAASGSTTLTITFAVTDDGVSLTDQDLGFTINLTNPNAA